MLLFVQPHGELASRSLVHIPPKYLPNPIIYFYNYYSLFGFCSLTAVHTVLLLVYFLANVYLGQLLLLEQIDLLLCL